MTANIGRFGATLYEDFLPILYHEKFNYLVTVCKWRKISNNQLIYIWNSCLGRKHTQWLLLCFTFAEASLFDCTLSGRLICLIDLSSLLLNYNNYIHFLIQIFDMCQNLLFRIFDVYNCYCTIWRSRRDMYWLTSINSYFFSVFNLNHIFISMFYSFQNKCVLLIRIHIETINAYLDTMCPILNYTFSGELSENYLSKSLEI